MILVIRQRNLFVGSSASKSLADQSCRPALLTCVTITAANMNMKLIYLLVSTLTPSPKVLYVQMRHERPRRLKETLLSGLHRSPHAPYWTWPIGLSSSMPGAIKFVLGSPDALAAEHRAIVGELHVRLATEGYGRVPIRGCGFTNLLEITSVK